MRITALAAAVAMASSGCVTATALALVHPDSNAHDDTVGPIVVGGLLVDGISMTALGAGALDGHSSVGWSRGEGEWAMGGGIALLVIDAVVIALAIADEHDSPPPPPTAPVTCDAPPLAGHDLMIVYYRADSPGPRIGETTSEAAYQTTGYVTLVEAGATTPMPLGAYLVCAVYNPHPPGSAAPVDQVACLPLTIGGTLAQRLSFPPPTITSPR